MESSLVVWMLARVAVTVGGVAMLLHLFVFRPAMAAARVQGWELPWIGHGRFLGVVGTVSWVSIMALIGVGAGFLFLQASLTWAVVLLPAFAAAMGLVLHRRMGRTLVQETEPGTSRLVRQARWNWRVVIVCLAFLSLAVVGSVAAA